MQLKDRIKELRRVKPSELIPNPKNWRTHPEAQKNALKGVLAEVGIADAVLAREMPDGELMLIDGHLRAETTTASGDQEIPVLVLDVTESEADKILLTLDPMAAMAGADSQLLDTIMRDVQTESEAVADLLDKLAQENGLYEIESEDEAEEKLPDKKAAFQIGEITWKTERNVFDTWLDTLREEVGFDAESIENELKVRLRLPT
jgi:hypothetical protein